MKVMNYARLSGVVSTEWDMQSHHLRSE